MRPVNAVNNIHLPPSAVAVYNLLKDGQPRTFKEISKTAEIAPRTIRYALKKLKDNGLIIEKFNFHDARQIIYQIRETIVSEDISTVMAL